MKNRLLNNCMEHKFKKIDFYCPGAYGIVPGAPKLELRQNQLLYSTSSTPVVCTVRLSQTIDANCLHSR